MSYLETPLLKEEIKKGIVVHEDFILGYMVNDGYAEDIVSWHKNNKYFFNYKVEHIKTYSLKLEYMTSLILIITVFFFFF